MKIKTHTQTKARVRLNTALYQYPTEHSTRLSSFDMKGLLQISRPLPMCS